MAASSPGRLLATIFDRKGFIMRRAIVPASLAVLMLTASPARAEHAKINLDVVAPGDQKTAFVDQTPPDAGKNPRPVVKAKVGDPIKAQWLFTNVYPHKTLENV